MEYIKQVKAPSVNFEVLSLMNANKHANITSHTKQLHLMYTSSHENPYNKTTIGPNMNNIPHTIIAKQPPEPDELFILFDISSTKSIFLSNN